ncbi:MAG: helix-turn-helix transcriptional regulator [Veillonellaceae bacterium]|nr:helix-turn-helix transcriptional regulator [Veillonellaceae bacterium]
MGKTYGQTLKLIREARGLSQEELAFKTDLHRTFISLLERDRKSPSLRTVTTIATALGMTLLDFVQRMSED